MVSFKELLKLNDEDKKKIIIIFGLAILVAIHAIDLLIVYWAVKYSEWDAFVIAVITMMFGDLIALVVSLVMIIFNIKPSDLNEIKIDDMAAPISG